MQLNKNIKIHKGDCTKLMKKLPDASVDAIVTDPPYGYLKHKFDCPFDEPTFFNEAKRILKKDGFIVMFGRGTAFYRWNTILANLGFTFKEEIIWNKRMISSPYAPLMRIHETVSVFTKGRGCINKNRVPYIEANKYDIKIMQNDIKRLMTCFSSLKNLSAVQNYLETQKINYNHKHKDKFCVTYSKGSKSSNRCANVAKKIDLGCIEKSIIEMTRDHYTATHPTQKPVRLIERLLALVTKKGDLVLDAFMGSGSAGVACINTGRKFIGYEIDDEYFEIAKERLEETIAEKCLIGCESITTTKNG